LLAVCCLLFAVGCWLLAVGCGLLAVGCWHYNVFPYKMRVKSKGYLDLKCKFSQISDYKRFVLRESLAYYINDRKNTVLVNMDFRRTQCAPKSDTFGIFFGCFMNRHFGAVLYHSKGTLRVPFAIVYCGAEFWM
ncbi:hypothetical protein, partial [Muribacter muris]|uniref:hypothetical protein n=1 Tax=Muribacter muris TaxID=67855 RepID=UPI00064DEF5D